MNTNLVSFDKFRARIFEHGIHEITKSNDDTEITFLLNNGEVYQIYTKEVEVQYATENDWVFVQSEMAIAQKVEP